MAQCQKGTLDLYCSINSTISAHVIKANSNWKQLTQLLRHTHIPRRPCCCCFHHYIALSTRWCLGQSSASMRITRRGADLSAHNCCDFLKETCLEHSQRGWGAPWLLWMGEVWKHYLCYSLSMLSHIFFDDCMERASGEKGEMIVNQFVRHLINAINDYGRKW